MLKTLGFPVISPHLGKHQQTYFSSDSRICVAVSLKVFRQLPPPMPTLQLDAVTVTVLSAVTPSAAVMLSWVLVSAETQNTDSLTH